MATAFIDSDLHGAASHRNMATHLTAPLGTGAMESPVAFTNTGAASVGWAAREPLLLCAPRDDLGERGLRARVQLPGGAIVTLAIAAYTEHGAALPVLRPPTDQTGFATPFSITVTSLREVFPDGSSSALASGQIAARLELRLVEGITGRLIYIMGAEKQRLRRLARELAAMRRLRAARDDALDRIGAELGVPRFADNLGFRSGHVVTDVRREPDAEYRRRLGIYRPWRMGTHGRITDLLNGPGLAGDHNAGPLGDMGLTERFTLAERDNPFALAIHIVGAEDSAYRDNFLEFVRQVHLIWPHASANSVHSARFQTQGQAQRVEAVRSDVRDGFSIVGSGQNTAIAPMLASALARVWRCRKALKATTKWPVKRAQDSTAGSRYELGLGADLEPLPTAELNRLGQEHAARQKSTDPEVEGLLAAMTPETAANDPEGRWLLEPCGIQTVHRVNTTTQYVSHLPAFGLAISGPDQLTPAGWTAIVPGGFAPNPENTALLFYERSTGTGAFYSTDGSGGITLLRQNTGWRQTWTRIVPGDFGGGTPDDLLFYERSTGHAEFYSTDGSGAIAQIRQINGWRKTWAEIVPGNFGPSSRSDLLFYDRSAGEIEIWATDPSVSKLGTTSVGERATWSHIVPWQFVPGSYTDLAFYDRSTGMLELRTTDGKGVLSVLRRHPDFGTGWTHVLAGRFGSGSATAGLMFYDRVGGRAAFYSVASDGKLKLLHEHSGWRRTWTRIVAGQFAPSAPTDLLFYERSSGTGEFYSTNGQGQLTGLRQHQGWRKSSPQQFEARYHAAGDPGTNVILVAGIAAADAVWRAAPFSGPGWTQLTRAQAEASWQAATPRPANDPALGVFRAAGMPGVETPGPIAQQLLRLPQELLETVRLAPAQAQAIIAGQPAAGTALRDLVGVLRSQQIASVLPLVTSANEVVLVLGAIGLPGAGVNLQDRRSTGFRWYALPIQGTGADISATGSRALMTPADAGVYALVVVGYARTGDTDPYEFRVELPDGALLDVRQYEFLMNVLERAYPAGVEVNTFSIRREHVDLDGDGAPDPLSPAVSRTYRAFQRRRLRGEVGVTLKQT